MNILLVSHDLSVTGAPNSLLRQACYFRDAGHNVDIISYIVYNDNLKQMYIKEGFNPIIIQNSEADIREAYYKQNKKYDFILCNTTVTYKAVDFLQHQNTPLVWFIRETMLVDKGMMEDADFANVFRNFYNIYTVSDYAAKVCKKYNKNVRIINNAVADNFKKFKPITKKLVFGFIGQIAYVKGINFLIDAFNKLTLEYQNTELHIAGNLDHNFAKELQNMNIPNIKWFGEVQKQDKEKFFDSIDVLIVPSLDEPSGLTVIEGAMYGKPIITTDKTGANYIVKNNKSGFIVKAGDTEDLYNHMKKILDCDLFSMSKISRKMYLKYGTTDRERQKVLKMLKDNKKNFPVINLYKCRVDLCKWYKEETKKDLNLDNPQTFNEKIQYLKLYNSTPIKTKLADKFLVRKWVADKIGKKYLIPLLGVYDSFDEIDFDKLPNQFVIKCNHGSGYNIVVKDKSQLDLKDAKQKIDSWMSEDFAFKNGFELHYHNIKHKIIIEEYIDSSMSNYEIQLWAFNGKIKFVSVETNKTADVLYRGVFYPDGKQCEFQVTPNHYKNINNIPCIKSFKKALKIGKKLLLKTPYVRIDFIDFNDDIKFREITFTSGSGLSKIVPEVYTNRLGDWIKLPRHEYNIETGRYRLARRDMKYNIKMPVIQYTKHNQKIKLNIFGTQVLKIKNTDKDYVVYLLGLQIFKRHISNNYAKINILGIRVFKYKI